MKTSVKALVQNPEGRGYVNGDYNRLGNHTNEVTFNVTKGVNTFDHYYKILGRLKFATIEDAKEYLGELGVEPGTTKTGEEHYSLTEQDGCCFTSIAFHPVNSSSNNN